MRYIELTFVVICVVAVLQALGRKLPVPMPLLQVAAGGALSSFAFLDSLDQQSSLLFVMLVPPLLYMEAWLVPKRELWRAIVPVLGLAIGLVALTIVLVGYGMNALFPAIPIAACLALAAALAPTDTVAVGTLVGKLGLPRRHSVILSGESLFNDAVALVVFQVAIGVVMTGHLSIHKAAFSFMLLAVGGLAVGVAVAFIAIFIRRRLASDAPDSAAVDTMLSLLTPYAAYLAAEKLDVSGVLAVVAAGLCAGIVDHGHLRTPMRHYGKAVWSTACLTLNGSVFVMLGLEIRQVLRHLDSITHLALFGYVMLSTASLIAIRMTWLLVGMWISRRLRRPVRGLAEGPMPIRARLRGQLAGAKLDEPLGIGHVFVLSLCGVRGALTLTATLSIPLVTDAGVDFPGRDLAVFLAAGTIVATLSLYGMVSLWMGRRTAEPHDEPLPRASTAHL